MVLKSEVVSFSVLKWVTEILSAVSPLTSREEKADNDNLCCRTLLCSEQISHPCFGMHIPECYGVYNGFGLLFNTHGDHRCSVQEKMWLVHI